jgi:hypothetical protein
MSNLTKNTNKHPNIYEIIGLFVVIAVLLFLVHYVTSMGFMYLFAFPALYLTEKIQNTVFPFLESALPRPIGGVIAIVTSVLGGVVLYVLIIGLLMFLAVRISILLRSTKRED